MNKSSKTKNIQVENIDTCYLCGNAGAVHFSKMKDRLFGLPGHWDYKRCSVCGLNWLTPRPKNPSEAYINYYTHTGPDSTETLLKGIIQFVKNSVGASAFGYPDRINKRTKHILGKLLSCIGPLKEVAGRSVMWLKGDQRGRLLDIGCGSGLFLAHMQNFGWQVTGVEPDPDAARNTREQFNLLDIHTGSLESVALKESSFDAVTMNHVLEHLPDPVQTLKQCWRVLRPGGQLVVTTPNAKSLGKQFFKKNWLAWDAPRHVFLFDTQTLRKCAQKAGFRPKEIRTVASMAFYIWQSGRILKKAGVLPGAIPQHPTKIEILQALGFWMLEYSLNCFWPCGEELVMSVHKPSG